MPSYLPFLEAEMLKLAGPIADAGRRLFVQGAHAVQANAPAARAALEGAGGYLKRQVGATGAGLGLGGLGGAVLGGGVSGVRAYSDARDQGSSTAGAALRGLGGALPGAAIGGLAGMGLGSAAGLASGARGAELSKALSGRQDLLGKASRFGQRQVHGLTDALPAGHGSRQAALEAIGAGAAPARARVEAATKGIRDAISGTDVKAMRKAIDAHTTAETSLRHAQKAEDLGLTSVPGYVRSLLKNPVETAKTVAGDQWHSGGIGHKALTFGMPALGVVEAVRSKGQEGAPGPAERALSNVGMLATPSTLPIAGLIGVGALTGKALQTTGAGIDALRRRKMQGGAPPLAADNYSPPIERQYSPGAAGRAPEDLHT